MSAAPYAPDSATSAAAARATAPRAPTHRERIYRTALRYGAQGITRKQLAQYCSLSENTVRPRVLELIAAGLLEVAPALGVRDGCSVLVATQRP